MRHPPLLPLLVLGLGLGLAGCGRPESVSRTPATTTAPEGEAARSGPAALQPLIRSAAAEHGIPEALLHRVIRRESDYRPEARNGPYRGLMQIHPDTARSMGFRGAPQELLDPAVNLRYAGRYLRGAWIVADGDPDAAVMWYARGYYYAARDRCLLVATGLAAREVNRRCR